jgi:excisionase family DNA binding protein
MKVDELIIQNDGKLVSTEELADLLGVTTRTIANLIKARKIPVVKVGNRNRFNPTRVVKTLEIIEIK